MRTTNAPDGLTPTIRALLAQMDRHAAMTDVATIDRIVSTSLVRPRFYAAVLGLFAAVAVALAILGIFGAVSFAVVQRTREIGIRLALGGNRWRVLALLLRQGVRLALSGVGVGVIGAALLAQYLDALLFGLSPLDPGTFILVPLAFSGVVLSAVLLAARRALTVDPILALRHD